MNKKIIVSLIVLLFCVSCLGIVSADNSTNETLESNESETVDMSNYIMPISITDNGIEFNDGFTGFCLDLTKDPITTDDGFVSEGTGGDEIQNYVKLAIIEAYKQGCEDDLGKIINSFIDGSYKNSNDKVIAAVLESQETVGDESVVELEDSIEGTFEFELLKDVNGNKSDCLAYKVSLKEMPDDAKLAATADDNLTDDDNGTDDTLTNSSEDTENITDNEKDDEKIENTTDDNKTQEKQDDKKIENTTDNKQDDKKTENTTDNNNQKHETIVNETNKTIINKTNTLTINENNTTTVNVKNNKVINKTNDVPQNATIQDKIMKTVGNPIFLLIVVVAIAAIAAVAMRRKE